MNKKPKIIVVLGPTATGKSDLAVEIAKKFNGEIVSADSRQVYKGMNIGTGKITKKEMGGVPHHLLDVVSPKSDFDVVKYKKLADAAIKKIMEKGKIPIICGGTGFYIDAVVKNIEFPNILADKKLRAKLEKKSTTELFETLKKLDPERARSIDPQNKRRLIRATEIIITTGKKIGKLVAEPKYNALKIGIKLPAEIAKKRIKNRLNKRIRQGMVAEVKRLKNPPAGGGVSWKKLYDFGLEYRCVSLYLRGKLSKNEMVEKLSTAIWRYHKRQITWFKRDKKIHWENPYIKKGLSKIIKLCEKFLK